MRLEKSANTTKKLREKFFHGRFMYLLFINIYLLKYIEQSFRSHIAIN